MRIVSLFILLLFSSQLFAEKQENDWLEVSGTAIHYFSSAIAHSEVATDGGKIVQSTDTIDISGDLNGRVLYHVTSVFDFAKQTLTNSGHQVFSGSILGSEPVLILDDEFEFNVKLDKGETNGKVFLTKTLAGKKIKCHLVIVGTGMTAAGDGMAAYTGKCKGIKKP